MKFGVCCGASGADAAARAGLAYIEPALAAVRGMENAQLDSMRREAENAGVTVDGFNCFFGGEVALYRDDPDDIVAYAVRNFETALRLGGKYCVVGSGRSRNIPDGYDREKAEERFTSLMSRIGKEAGARGLTVCLEPLCRAETNFINTLTDCIGISRRISDPNVGCLVDFYHFFMNGEELSEFDELASGELRHVHIARPSPDRGCPRAEDAETVAAWAAALRSVGYDGRISLECSWKDFGNDVKTGAGALAVFK